MSSRGKKEEKPMGVGSRNYPGRFSKALSNSGSPTVFSGGYPGVKRFVRMKVPGGYGPGPVT